MPKSKTLAALLLVVSALAVAVHAQTPQLLKKTTTKTDKLDFGAGGTIAIAGAPNGSITIVGSSKNEIEITAEIEVQAMNEADMARLASVTDFITQESTGRFGVITVGTQNRVGDKKLWKKFPKNLLDLPYQVNYTLSVPRYSDLEIDGGKGDLNISGIDGALRINFLDSNAKIELKGGTTTVTIGTGTADLTIPSNGWRGRSVDFQMVKGDLTVHLPSSISAEIDAVILRTGKIENLFPGLKPRVRKGEFTEKSIVAKAGNGGIPIKFTVGDGTMKLMDH
ncbi:MAG TPA: hypothetical protein PLP07_10670 [Pyrinomonadaceae bacterium]|nr:hypothetical protein [Chloracidobacterium sp.]MBP9935225.1 hypothetical protein [Pyrinomonadaceae bacterium]MBK9438273.1 hypothetical protein [Chloracidobacterium sp.]MBL0240844.1 hypothetical protein [Chloracidobacterium sp.]HQX56382.1 hypothetical protein [Pyrinomonadaceae bacterium]